jgi:hypothetical protein
MRAAPLVTLLAFGCGDGAAAGGGLEHLPTLGAGPYGALGIPLVRDLAADLGDPTARDEHDGLRLWFTRTPAGGGSEIWTATLTSFEETATEIRPALAADQAWEMGSVRAPSVVELPGGDLALYYQGGPSTIGRAISADGGDTWQKEGPLLEDASDPAALVVEGSVLLYHGRPGVPGVWRSDRAEPVIPGGSEPGAVGGLTATGRIQIGLFHVVPWEGGLAVAYAGSHDGVTFVPSFAGEPVLDPDSPDERAPEAHLHADQGFLFYGERRGATSVIGGAVHP